MSGLAMAGERGDLVALEGGWTATVTAAGAARLPSELAEAGLPISLPQHLGNLFAGEDLDERDVWLRRELELAQATPARLVLERLGPIAELFIDDQPKLSTRNLFRGYALDLDLAAGPHRLAICLRSPARALAERRPRPKWKTRLVASQQLRFLRTSLLGRIPSWSSVGAPRGVYATPRLLLAGRLRAEDVRLSARLEGEHGLVVAILPTWAQVERATLRVGAHTAALTRTAGGPLSARLTIVDPPRWWPHTHGEPARLLASLELEGSSLPLGAIGFRTVEADADTRRFGLRVNGVPVFCRGAVHVPQPWELDFAPTRRALEALRDAGGNMVRIGGTMRYEAAEFFAACDELGLLVWQDFMLANMDYPVEDAAFVAELTAEVDEQLLAWARHPSIAVLCGGSEVAQQAAMVGQPEARWYGPLFEQLLPDRCRALLPEVPYVTGSPSSARDADGPDQPAPLPFRPDRGVAHYYGVGAYLRDFDDARRAEVTFASECLGLSNVPEAEAVEALFGDDLVATHTPRWKAGVPRDNGAGWDFEDVRDHYLRALFGQDALTTRYADAEGYLELSRIVSAEVMTRVFSEWRRAGSSTRGGLVWFLRDLSPGAGWGLLDSEGREKAPLQALRRVWASTALLVTDEGTNGIRLHVVHEGATERRLTLRVALYRGADTLVAEASRELVVAPRSTTAHDGDGLFGGFRDLGWAYRFGPRAHEVLLASLHDGERLIAEAAHLPCLPLHPADAGLSTEVTRIDEQRARLVVRAQRLALFTVARVPGWRADAGYFHLAPGGARELLLTARVTAAAPTPAPLRGFVHALGATPARVSAA